MHDQVKTSLQNQVNSLQLLLDGAQLDKTSLQDQVNSLQLDLDKVQLDKGEKEKHNHRLQGQVDALEDQVKTMERVQQQATASLQVSAVQWDSLLTTAFTLSNIVVTTNCYYTQHDKHIIFCMYLLLVMKLSCLSCLQRQHVPLEQQCSHLL